MGEGSELPSEQVLVPAVKEIRRPSLTPTKKGEGNHIFCQLRIDAAAMLRKGS